MKTQVSIWFIFINMLACSIGRKSENKNEPAPVDGSDHEELVIQQTLQSHRVPCEDVTAWYEASVPDASKRRQITCGTVQVPESYEPAHLEGRKITLRYVYFAPRSGKINPVPVVYVGGGPDSTPIMFFNAFKDGERFLPLIDAFGLLLFEYRGAPTGPATMARYPDSEKFVYSTSDLKNWPVTTKSVLEHLKANLPFDFYSLATANKARDLITLTSELGFKKFHYYGMSYATLIAQHVLRFGPERIASMFLESIFPYGTALDDFKNFASILERMDGYCRMDPTCAAHFGQSATKYDALVRRIFASGFAFPSGASVDGTILPNVLSESDGGQAVNVGKIAKRIYELEELDDHGLQKELSNMGFEDISFPIDPHYWLAICTERRLDHEGYGNFTGFPVVQKKQEHLDTVCKAWLGEHWNDPPLPIPEPAKQVKLMLVSGDLDATTPDTYAERVKRDFPQARTLLYRGFGHSIRNDNNDCPESNRLSFFNSPDGTLQACVKIPITR